MKSNRKLLAAIGAFCALGTDQSLATAQIPDLILIDGEKHRIHSEPLAPYLRSHPDLIVSLTLLCTASWRGYRATWEITEGKLYLIEIDSDPCSNTARAMPLTYYFRNDSERKFADWYSGVISIPQGKLVQVLPGGYSSRYERYITLTINDGIVVDTEQHDLAEEDRRNEAQWQEFRTKLRKKNDEAPAAQGEN